MSRFLTDDFRLMPWDVDIPEWCDPLGTYAETYWLPLLRAAPYVMGRRLVTLWTRHAARDSGGVLVLNIPEIEAALGMRSPRSNQSFDRIFDQLLFHRLARVRGDSILEIQPRWSRLSSHKLAKLPPKMQQAEPEFWELDWTPNAPNVLAL